MSMTPRTDSETIQFYRDGYVAAEFARTLERELAAERARLDWLIAGGVCLVQHSGGFYASRLNCQVSRAAIDAGMKEGAK